MTCWLEHMVVRLSTAALESVGNSCFCCKKRFLNSYAHATKRISSPFYGSSFSSVFPLTLNSFLAWGSMLPTKYQCIITMSPPAPPCASGHRCCSSPATRLQAESGVVACSFSSLASSWAQVRARARMRRTWGMRRANAARSNCEAGRRGGGPTSMRAAS